MTDMLQGRRVDFAPAGRVAQAAGGDEGRRQLRRHHVQQVEVLSARLVLPSASFTSNQALRAAPSTFTRLELNASSAEYLRTYSISGGTKSATPNNAAPARSNSTSMSCSTPSRSQWSQDRYMAFCGAPAHLIGIAGWVNSALPPRRPRTSSQV